FVGVECDRSHTASICWKRKKSGSGKNQIPGNRGLSPISRQPSSEIEAIIGYLDEPELIHRDNLVLLL
ncbi:MAG: hypothetical protein LC123_07585, partial [Burkholderiales bacterium]|nr:hypothetical protein [Burkholderiales bacterium]